MIITSVVKSNRAPFMNLAPKELMENLDLEERFALGAIDNDENGKFASGILIFDVWEGSGGGGNSIAAVLKWIYVSKEGRRRGAADAMMKKMLDLLGGNGVEAVICDLPMDGEYNLLCGYLEEWGFDFAIQESYELEVPLRKLNRPPFTEKLQTDSIVPFSALPSRTIAAGTARLKKQMRPRRQQRRNGGEEDSGPYTGPPCD